MEYLSKPVGQNKSYMVTVSSHGVLKMIALHVNLCSWSFFGKSPWSRLCCICLFKFVIITLHYITLHCIDNFFWSTLHQNWISHCFSSSAL